MTGHSRFDVFKSREDFVNWDKLIEDCNFIEELTPDEREASKNALQKLRRIFGEGFLMKALQTGHPLSYYLIRNMASWTRVWLIWLTDAIEAMRGADGFEAVLKGLRIKKRNDSYKPFETLSVLEIGHYFFRAGFKVAFEPSVIVLSNRKRLNLPDPKRPDLKLLDEETDQELFVEVTDLGASDPQVQANRTWDNISDLLYRALFDEGLVVYARINEILDNKHLDPIRRQVEELITRVKSDQRAHTLVIDRTVEIGIAPQPDEQVISVWAAEREIDVGFAGPRIPLNEPARLRRKIRDKVGQLPKSKPGIIVVNDRNLLSFAHSLEEIVEALKQEISGHPNLLCAVVSQNYLGAEASTAVSTSYYKMIQRTKANPLMERTVILLNESFELKVASATVERICNAFLTMLELK